MYMQNFIINANHENKQYITAHTPTITSRVLSECNINTPIYDNDADMKSVKENFDRQTSQRFEEYEKRMITQRKKNKEQRDKDIQKIILKDKMEKSLAEKVEKGCLRCGFGLGGVAAGVGIFGAIAVNEWTKAAMLVSAQKGIEAGVAKAIDELGKIVELREFNLINWDAMVTSTTYNKPMDLVKIVSNAYYKCKKSTVAEETRFCLATKAWDKQNSTLALQTISTQAAEAAAEAGKAAKATEEAEMTLANAKSSYLYSAIGYSVLAILIIVLVMVIIYLILRYRRKKKMNKKLQYTKLLNQ
ncbi:hypothetical protein PFNF135_00667 [Plasmodium falciparum NF135/5.C10]|uniref:Surface antigen n=1 Tax=Plasmodium falciparum NF135/5.C10 TaxID=1036726 RepID=W4IN29_PLAFA|nr:hypothetical protein PFNF135_00667 [Plasmodium falciparum NF135/5.C10]